MTEKNEVSFDERFEKVKKVANEDDLAQTFSLDEHDQLTDLELRLSEKKEMTTNDQVFIEKLFKKLA